MRFSLIHPSRGRPALAEHAIEEWLSHASRRHDYEYLLSVDEDDPERATYEALAARRNVRLLAGRNRSMVDAVNRAARAAGGDVLVVVSDDFGCPRDWDDALAAAIGSRRDVAVLVNDSVDGRVMTLPIVDRAYFDRCGYIYYPEYLSMFADDDLTEHAARTGRLIDARALTFPHRHHSRGGAAADDTSARQERPLAWMRGRRVLERRRATAFGAAAWSPSLALRLLGIELRGRGVVLGSRIKRRLRGLPPP